MADSRISQRYAASLLLTSIEKKNLNEAASEIGLLVETLKDNRKLQLMLESPVVKPESKLKILKEIFGKKISKDTVEFIEFIVSKKRENLIGSIGKRFLELLDDHLGIANVFVTAPAEFSDEQINVLRNKLEKILAKKVRLNFKTDASLVGGFIVKVDDTLFDASVRHQLELLKKQFLKSEIPLN